MAVIYLDGNSESTSTSLLIFTTTKTLPMTTTTISDEDTTVWEQTTISTNVLTSRMVTVLKAKPTTTSSTELPKPTETEPLPTETTESIEEPSSTSFTIQSTSDLPTNYNFGNISGTTSSNGLQVGVAVGIPIAIFVIIFICLGVWYFIRFKKGKNIITANSHDEETTLSEKPYPIVFSPGAYMKEPYKQQAPPPPEPQTKLNRLSQMFNFPIRGNYRMSVITPVLLKKFNLGKKDDEDTVKAQSIPKVEPPLPSFKLPPVAGSELSTSSYYEQSIYTVIKSYTRRLGDELSINLHDKCIILEKHSDGWCKIRMIYDYKEGLVPKMCLQKIE
ncbi:unnamed protein product [Candida verbasci]|uniref:SH3 domain-containing protein n=1 Tax=Candida verbasci TaxID=1227364 RepID=A0A9W4TVF1_9ASCO|nr:unnamed protein product [Candida verbasci]